MLRSFFAFAFAVAIALGAQGGDPPKIKKRDFVGAIPAYFECKAWEAVFRREEGGIIPDLTKEEIKLIKNVNDVCYQIEDSLKSLQEQLDNYRDYYNTVFRDLDPAVRNKTERVRNAYKFARKDYISRFPKAESPYTPCVK